MLRDWAILLTLLAEVVVLSRLDRRLYGTWVTPFNVLAFPYTAVIFLCYFFSPVLEFVPLYTPSVVIWIVGLLVLWAGGAFLGWGVLDLSANQPNCGNGLTVNVRDLEPRALAVRFSWLAMPLLLYGIVVSAQAAGGWSQIGSNEFKAAYSHGLHAHAEIFASLLAILLIGLYSARSRFQLITIYALVAAILLSQVKGHVLLVILGGLLFRILTGSMRLSMRRVAITLAATYIIFNAAYIITMTLSSSGEPLAGATYSFLARHYCYYLFSGPLSLSEVVRSGAGDVGGDWTTIFAPFINVYHALLSAGPLVAAGSTHEKGMIVDFTLATDGGDNVYTFFGTLYLYLGPLGGILYAFVAGFLSYGFLAFIRVRNNTWLTAAYCAIAAQLSLGFFELYFWYLTTYEVIVLGLCTAWYSRVSRTGPISPIPLTSA